MPVDKYNDRYVENINPEKDVIKCYKCNKYYYPEIADISRKRPSVYYLYCSACRIKNLKYQRKQALKKSMTSTPIHS